MRWIGCATPVPRSWAIRNSASSCCCPRAGSRSIARSGALFDWCRGFLGGFGLAVGTASRCPRKGRRRLRDLANLGGCADRRGRRRRGRRGGAGRDRGIRARGGAAAARRLRAGGRSTASACTDRHAAAHRHHWRKALRAPPPAADAHGRRRRDPGAAGRARAHPQPRHPLPVSAGFRLLVPDRLPRARRGAGAGARPQARRGDPVLPRARPRARRLGRPAAGPGRRGGRLRPGRRVSDRSDIDDILPGLLEGRRRVLLPLRPRRRLRPQADRLDQPRARAGRGRARSRRTNSSSSATCWTSCACSSRPTN